MYNNYETVGCEAANRCEEARCDRGVCANVVLAFLASLFTFVIGLIVGVAAYETFANVLPVLISLAVVFAALIIALIIWRVCLYIRRCHPKRCG